MKPRHKFFWAILRPLIIVFCWLWFGYTCRKPKGLQGSYILLANHTTDFDPLFVGAALPKQTYFVASEHISRWKVFPLLDWLLAPILRYKGTVALSTAVEILKKVRAGGNVALFAEGMRSWDGETGPILPSTAKLVKSAGCGLVTYKLIGGYFVSPNWSEKSLRRGHVRGEPAGVYTKEQIEAMSLEELEALIARDLHENAYDRQERERRIYRGKRLAEKLENLLYLCPFCGEYDTLSSGKDTVTCSRCGGSFTYDRFGFLRNAPETTVHGLCRRQKERAQRDVEAGVAYTAPKGKLSAISKHQSTLVAEGEVCLSPEELRCGDFSVPTAEISDLAIHGRHELVFSVGRDYYELAPDRLVSAYKFFLWFGIYKQYRKGRE